MGSNNCILTAIILSYQEKFLDKQKIKEEDNLFIV